MLAHTTYLPSYTIETRHIFTLLYNRNKSHIYPPIQQKQVTYLPSYTIETRHIFTLLYNRNTSHIYPPIQQKHVTYLPSYTIETMHNGLLFPFDLIQPLYPLQNILLLFNVCKSSVISLGKFVLCVPIHNQFSVLFLTIYSMYIVLNNIHVVYCA